MNPRFLWIIAGIVIVVVLVFAGLTPLSAEKEKVSLFGESFAPESTQSAGTPHASQGELSAPVKR